MKAIEARQLVCKNGNKILEEKFMKKFALFKMNFKENIAFDLAWQNGQSYTNFILV